MILGAARAALPRVHGRAQWFGVATSPSLGSLLGALPYSGQGKYAGVMWCGRLLDSLVVSLRNSGYMFCVHGNFKKNLSHFLSVLYLGLDSTSASPSYMALWRGHLELWTFLQDFRLWQ